MGSVGYDVAGRVVGSDHLGDGTPSQVYRSDEMYGDMTDIMWLLITMCFSFNQVIWLITFCFCPMQIDVKVSMVDFHEFHESISTYLFELNLLLTIIHGMVDKKSAPHCQALLRRKSAEAPDEPATRAQAESNQPNSRAPSKGSLLFWFQKIKSGNPPPQWPTFKPPNPGLSHRSPPGTKRPGGGTYEHLGVHRMKAS